MVRAVQSLVFVCAILALVDHGFADDEFPGEKPVKKQTQPWLLPFKLPVLDLGVNSDSGRSIVDTILSVSRQGLNFALNVDPNVGRDPNSRNHSPTTSLGKALSNGGEHSQGPVNVDLSIGFPDSQSSKPLRNSQKPFEFRSKRNIQRRALGTQSIPNSFTFPNFPGQVQPAYGDDAPYVPDFPIQQKINKNHIALKSNSAAPVHLDASDLLNTEFTLSQWDHAGLNTGNENRPFQQNQAFLQGRPYNSDNTRWSDRHVNSY